MTDLIKFLAREYYVKFINNLSSYNVAHDTILLVFRVFDRTLAHTKKKKRSIELICIIHLT